jgi:hypothetical protein
MSRAALNALALVRLVPNLAPLGLKAAALPWLLIAWGLGLLKYGGRAKAVNDGRFLA